MTIEEYKTLEIGQFIYTIWVRPPWIGDRILKVDELVYRCRVTGANFDLFGIRRDLLCGQVSITQNLDEFFLTEADAAMAVIPKIIGLEHQIHKLKAQLAAKIGIPGPYDNSPV